MPLNSLLKEIRSDISGATAVEYGLILALIFLAIVASVQTLANDTNTMWSDVNTAVTEN